jgi:hypothetical protein
MSEKIDGTQADKVFNHAIARFSGQKYGKYPMLTNKFGGETVKIAGRIATNVKKQINKDICLTQEQKKQFESNLIEAAKRINDKRPLSSIINATKSILGFAPRSMNGLKENARNLFSNVVHGPKNITDHGIRTEACLLADEIINNIQLRRGECDNCLQILCSGHSQ